MGWDIGVAFTFSMESSQYFQSSGNFKNGKRVKIRERRIFILMRINFFPFLNEKKESVQRMSSV